MRQGMNFGGGYPVYSGRNPPLAFDFRHPSRTSPAQPQNLMRPTAKGCGGRCGGECGPCSARTSGTGFGSLGRMGLGGLLGLKAVGDAYEEGRIPLGVWISYSIISSVASVAGAYHGYKRNNSVGWAVAWFFLSGMFPLIAMPVAFAQGYAKKA